MTKLGLDKLLQSHLISLFCHSHLCKKADKNVSDEEIQCSVLNCKIIKEAFRHIINCKLQESCEKDFCRELIKRLSFCKICMDNVNCFDCTSLAKLPFHIQNCENFKKFKVPNCGVPSCWRASDILNHVTFCKSEECLETICGISKESLTHWKTCEEPYCCICMPNKDSQRIASSISCKFVPVLGKIINRRKVKVEDQYKPVGKMTTLETLFYDELKSEVIFKFDVHDSLLKRTQILPVRFQGLSWQISLQCKVVDDKRVLCFNVECLGDSKSEFWSCRVMAEFRFKCNTLKSAMTHIKKLHHCYHKKDALKGTELVLNVGSGRPKHMKHQFSSCLGFSLEVWMTTNLFPEISNTIEPICYNETDLESLHDVISKFSFSFASLANLD